MPLLLPIRRPLLYRKPVIAAGADVTWVANHVNRASAGNHIFDIEFSGEIPDSPAETGFTIAAAPSGGSFTNISASHYATTKVDTKYLRFTLTSGLVDDFQAGHDLRASHDGTLSGVATFTNQDTLEPNNSSIDILDGYTWELDMEETSGTRADVVGSLDFTETNTVLTGTGKVGNAADFEQDNSEYLSRANSATFDSDTDYWYIGVWVNAESIDANDVIISQDTQATRDWELHITTTGFNLWVWNGTSINGLVAGPSPPSTSTWYYVLAGLHSGNSDERMLDINDGTWTGSDTMARTGSNNQHWVGARNWFGGQLFFDGLIESPHLIKRSTALSADEISSLYSSGNANPYPCVPRFT